jgi:hypothetical protein
VRGREDERAAEVGDLRFARAGAAATLRFVVADLGIAERRTGRLLAIP